MESLLIFNYINVDGGAIFTDLGSQIIKTYSPQRLTNTEENSLQNEVQIDGKDYQISGSSELIKTSYDRFLEMWRFKIELLKRFGFYNSTRIRLPCSSIKDRVRVVGVSPLPDKLVVSKLLFQELADLKSRYRVGWEERDSRIFVEITIGQVRENSFLPPMIVLEVVEGGKDMTFLNDGDDFVHHPTDEDFTDWSKDISTFDHAQDRPGELKFIYSVKLPEWVYRLVGTTDKLVKFSRGDPIRKMNLRLIELEFIDHLPYVDTAHLYVQKGIEYYYNPSLEESISDTIMHSNHTNQSSHGRWRCINCTFINNEDDICQMCSEQLFRNGQIECEVCRCDFEDPVWMSVNPIERHFKCEICLYEEAFKAETSNNQRDSERLFRQHVSCFSLGMTFSNDDFDLVSGHLTMFGGGTKLPIANIQLPVAIIPPGHIQDQIEHIGVSVKCAELNRIYYKSEDPIKTYDQYEYGYYQLLVDFVERLEEITGVACVELGYFEEVIEPKIEHLVKSLEIIESNKRPCGYRKLVLEKYHSNLEDYLTLQQVKKEKITEFREGVRETVNLLQLIRDAKFEQLPPALKSEKWREQVHVRSRDVFKIHYLSLYLLLGLHPDREEASKYNLQIGGCDLVKDSDRDRLNPIYNKLSSHYGAVKHLLDRFGENPPRLRQVGGLILGDLESYFLSSENSSYKELKTLSEIATDLIRVLNHFHLEN